MVVHRAVGPGLLESAHEACVAYELTSRNINIRQQKILPLMYKGVALDCSYRLDMVVENRVILEFKCANKIDPIHEAQMLTYLRISNLSVGLILNFHSPLMKSGVKRIVNGFIEPSPRTRRLGGE
jgi:GxxExxY protein